MRRFLSIILVAFCTLAPISFVAAQQAPAPQSTSVQTQPAVTVTTPAPGQIVTVTGDTATISGGSLLGWVITFAAMVLGTPIAVKLVQLIVAVEKRMGVQVSDANRDRLTQFVENGISLGAKKASADLTGKLNVSVRNQVAADALKYAQDHGADTLKALGFDPNDPKVIEGLEARIAKVLDDKAAAVASPVVINNAATGATPA